MRWLVGIDSGTFHSPQLENYIFRMGFQSRNDCTLALVVIQRCLSRAHLPLLLDQAKVLGARALSLVEWGEPHIRCLYG